jgi:3-oxoisoapionate decarboxylase
MATSRRDFLKITGVAAVPPPPSSGPAVSGRSTGGWSIKIGIDSFCYHRHFGYIYPNQKDPGTRWEFVDFINRVVQLGVGAVSVQTCYLKSLTPAYLAEIKAVLDEHRLDRVLAWGFPGGLEAGRNDAAAIEMNTLIRNAHHFGTRILRILASNVRFGNEPVEPRILGTVKVLRESVKIAADHGVVLALENHIDFTYEQIYEILQRVESDHLRVTFDTGNALRMMEDPVEAAKRLAPYIVATHMKDLDACRYVSPKEWYFFSSVPLGTGLIDFPSVLRVLKESGYTGQLCLEVDRPRDGQDEDALVVAGVHYLGKLVSQMA